MEFLGKLGIDIKLLIAQIINFLVLLWLLNRFLYKPLLKKLKERADKIKKVEEEQREIQRKKQEIEKSEETIIQQAKDKTREIIEEGRKISNEEKNRILGRAEEEMRRILKNARERAGLEVKQIKEKEAEYILRKSREILGNIFTSSFSKELHKKFVGEAIEKLLKLDFKKIRAEKISKITIVSAIPLSDDNQKKIKSLFLKKLGNITLQEKVDPNLISGIKIYIGSFLIDGSLNGEIKKAI